MSKKNRQINTSGVNEATQMHQTETHPWKWFVPRGAKVLVVGTFPPTKRNWSYDFFYPNKRNLFWPMVARIAGKELQYFSGAEAVNERKKLLIQLKTGITDMGLEITRNQSNSSDDNLEVSAFMDIISILVEHPSIKKIIFTSSSGKSSAAAWFLQYLKTKNIVHKFEKGARPLKSEVFLNGRMISMAILYSPSPRAANRISFDKLVELYADEILIR